MDRGFDTDAKCVHFLRSDCSPTTVYKYFLKII